MRRFAHHAVLHSAKHRCNDIATIIAVAAGERAQIPEGPRPFPAVGHGCFLLIDQGSSPVIPSGLAAQSRQRYGGSMAGLVGFRFQVLM
jgi:hypothetical protein